MDERPPCGLIPLPAMPGGGPPTGHDGPRFLARTVVAVPTADGRRWRSCGPTWPHAPARTACRRSAAEL